ncbi:aminotransferase class IV [Metallumcola ferriviriculae]|uniref:Aminotransferase class IV n=1 Tax=Metallumcola ferriviriculae TaxID=3039180 RepID=A0AAU0UKH1_9FIRM|nr:aminotransferase class IV [Desulfitibacteraceae bacterium MK1]
MYVYQNGVIKKKEDAALSIDDRGYTFGEGIYEVVRVYGGRVFTLADHWQRLKRSADEMEILLPDYFTRKHCMETISQLVEKNNQPESWVYLQVTRGVQFRSHGFLDNMTPMITMYLIPAGSWEKERQGVKVSLAEDIRWHRCDVKSTMLMANTLMKTRAAREGYFEVIFEREGFITEGSASNVFFVKEGELITPPLSNYILPGITRSYIMQLAGRLSLKCIERPVKVAELPTMDEIFVTATGIEAIPVSAVGQLDYRSPGPVYTQLMDEFNQDIEKLKWL